MMLNMDCWFGVQLQTRRTAARTAARLELRSLASEADIAKHIWKTRGFGGLMIGYAGMQVGCFRGKDIDFLCLETC